MRNGQCSIEIAGHIDSLSGSPPTPGKSAAVWDVNWRKQGIALIDGFWEDCRQPGHNLFSSPARIGGHPPEAIVLTLFIFERFSFKIEQLRFILDTRTALPSRAQRLA